MNAIWPRRKSPLDSAIAEKVQRSMGAVQQFFFQPVQRLHTLKVERQARIRAADTARFEALSYSAKRAELADTIGCSPSSYRVDDVLAK